jgi:hypothetical protein
MSPLWNFARPSYSTCGRIPSSALTRDLSPIGMALDHLPALYAAQELTTQQLQTFVEFPPRQKPASFNLDSLMEKMEAIMDGSSMH